MTARQHKKLAKIIGNRIWRYRLLRGLSVAELAKEANTTRQNIHRIEAGGSTSVAGLYDISAALRVPISHIAPKISKL